MRHADDQVTPRGAHPAFYGCFDWHSAVEMHWALVVLLRAQPDDVPARDVRALLDTHLTPENIAAEVAYLAANPGWERPYGWGWALQLAGELQDWAATEVEEAVRWAEAVRPLAEHLASELRSWLPRLTYPDRGGMHGNTAFALARALSWPDPLLRQAIAEAARRLYGSDTTYPASYEPSGTDFLSAFLTEAVLMTEVLDPDEFTSWWAGFAPDGLPERLTEPASVSDPQDGQGAHLHGLNLYRIHALRRLEPSVPAAHRARIAAAARAHEPAATAALADTGWMSEHWLGAYAVLAFR